MKKEKAKLVFTVGKRKRAIARAKIVPGTGKIMINSKPLEIWGNEYMKLRVKEPLLLAEDLGAKLDFYVNVKGGGTTGQTEAVRAAIARGLVEFFKNKELEEKFLNYDRNLLVFDFRRTEPHHGSGRGSSKRGSRRHRQRSKR
ncbi:MAG: 30S ribosomal protein S9 [Candidatus Aenigmatarchaeota archaeon]